MESKKNIKKNTIYKKVICEIIGGSHYVCRNSAESTGKLLATFFPLLTQFYSK